MRHLALVASIAVVSASGVALAADATPLLGPSDVSDADKGRLQVIQRRTHPLANELSLSGGVLPVDPYYKGWLGTVGFTHHFNDDVAWEVVQFSWAYNAQTALLQKLIRNAVASNDQVPELPAITWIAASHLVLKPLYGKEAFLNTRVFHLEAFLQAGPAVVGMMHAQSKVEVGADLGVGLRFWLSEAWSARFDAGELVYFHPVGGRTRVRQALSLRLGLAVSFGGDE
jgi:outer membrane beta-barrel protein